MVSVIMQYGQRTPAFQYTPERFNTLLDVAERAKLFDQANGEPHCEDPAKAAWLKETLERIEKRLTDIEATQARARVAQLLDAPAA